jgi:large subunit ribosomal protein L15
MLNQLKPKHKAKTRKRVARGGKRGTYAGRGCKGQKSRSGSNKEPIIRGWIKKYPKLRGYRFNARPKNYLEVNFDTLEENFKAEEKVSPLTLLEKGIICKIEKRIPRVKILGKGKITKALVIEDCQISKIAKEKIEKAKGSIKEKSKIQNPNVKPNPKSKKIEKKEKKTEVKAKE